MAKKDTSNFFGLFGCDSNKTKDTRPEKRPVETEELEEGEIADQDEFGVEENAQFDTLISSYQREVTQQITLKEAKKCLICSANVPKYTCPKCGMKTCSVNCCILHKKKFNCDGVRDRLSFVPLKSYSNQNFHSDCKFLEETCGVVNDSGRFFQNNSSRDVSNWTNRFIQEAIKRKIHYKKLPPLFKKAKLNRSLFIYKEKSILWDIEFILPYCLLNKTLTSSQEDIIDNGEFCSFTFKKSRISENTNLRAIIEDIITNGDYFKPELEELSLNESEKPQMSAYIQAPRNEIIVLFKHDSGKFYFIMDTSKTLLQNFADKTIVEYPTIVLILKSFLKDYSIKSSLH